MLGVSFLLLLGLMALSLPVAGALGVLGLSLEQLYSRFPLTRAIGEIAWNSNTEFLLVSVPMFILLGELLLRAGVAERMYDAMIRWLSWLPGGLMHSNIGSCAMFAATSGSSVATAATIGTVALPLVKRHRYNERLFLGTLAAGGTLGILIPPSINMIIYGVLTDTSVPKLYLAGIVPGLLLAGLFMIVVLVACLFRPAWGGVKLHYSWAERLASIVHLIPPFGIFLIVVGSIYVGIATPTEAAALGVLAALAIAAGFGRLNLKMFREALEATMRTTAMTMLIITAAYFLNFIISSLGLTKALTSLVTDLGLSPGMTLFVVIVFYVILGCFMETLSMMITTIPIIAPVMFSLGYDPVWYGILIVILIETALVTPPVGLNLFVVQSLRSSGGLNDVIIGTAPFVLAMFGLLGLITAFPDLVMWAPNNFD